ncbi:sensor histidine kinase [Amycolatopsis sp. YIM 10]|uniref:sensor histidine kinase n=1 Tax=Amycolatopsis sp. YIM 10 TaxID=2653857 RepID=UPI00128FCCA6|nr:histidine kinase [Amycolatopsis sp. YIM 10]QFU88127.1 Sensor histidine kinase DesK [Amycolatopsis sp. YIM 10]
MVHVRLDYRRLPPFTQDVGIALLYFAGGTVLYLSGIYPLFGEPTHLIWTRFVLLGTVCLLQLLRRLKPGVALVLAAVPFSADIHLGMSAPILIAFSDHLYAATLYGSRWLSRTMIGLAASGTIGAVVIALIVADDWRTAVLAAVAAVPFIITPVWWASNVRTHREIALRERANAEQLARIAELDRNAAVAGERARMARDLHDVIAGHLSAIAIQSEAALSIADDAKPDTMRTVLRSVRGNSVDALEEMRAMIGLLRSQGVGEDETTAPARLGELSKLVESARASGMAVTVANEVGPEVSLPAAVDLTAYRIAQEALTNAVKHAPGTSAAVRIRLDGKILTVEVTNELTTTRRESDAGHGLLNMRERAQAIGGSFVAGPADPGWRVFAALPIGGQA